MKCIICGAPELQFDIISRTFIEPKNPENVTGLICSDCLQLLLTSKQPKIRAAYQKAISADLSAKAKILKTFLQEEGSYGNTRTKNFRRNLDRTRIMPKVRPAGYKVRAEHTVGQLDKRRTAVC